MGFIGREKEEFVLILPETGIEEATRVAENLRDVVQTKKFVFGKDAHTVTCSTGICEFPFAGVVTVSALFKRLDEALYEAKKFGRNCVRVAA